MNAIDGGEGQRRYVEAGSPMIPSLPLVDHEKLAGFARGIMRRWEDFLMETGEQLGEDPEIEARGFQHLDTRITIHLKDGQVLEKIESAATGHPRKPMSREQLEAKFFECAELAISVEQARRAADMIWNLEKLERVGELHRILSG